MSSSPTNPGDGGWRKFFGALPLKSRLHLLAAVYCIFASFALVYNLASARDIAWYEPLIWGTFSGLVAVGWVLAASYTWKLLFVVVPASFVLPSIFGQTFWVPGRIIGGAGFPFVLFMAALIGGYVLVISFVGSEGVKSMRHRAEISLAREIHQRLVPPVAMTIGGLELFGSSDSATEVGGDLLDVVPVNGNTGLYVADVTGHGVPAGVMMSMIKSAVRMRARSELDLLELVGDLNAVLLDVQKPGMFATFAGLILNDGRSVDYCLAGHPPLLHYRAASQKVDRHEASGPPLGVVPDFPFASGTVEPAPGDVLVVLTDGLIEVFDAAGDDFGESRFIAAVASHGKRPLAEMHAALLAEVRRFGPQDDDQTLLLIRAVG